jgi:Predicted branched-chain amino acid permease (azaleucine resistance)
MTLSQFRQAFKAAFPHTIPVMAGYICLGGAFGILLQNAGYNFVWAGAMSITIFAGAMQFIAVNLLTSAFSLLNAFFITIMVNARHIFYGFSMLEKFENMGWAKPYLIFSLTDETFSLLYTITPPEGVSKRSFYFSIAFLNHLYWIAGGIIGALVGAQVPLDFTGVEFVMTALFVAIFTEQCRTKHNRIPAIIGLGGSALCLIIFGPDQFILPAMIVLVAALSFVRKPIEKELNTNG